MIARIRLAAMLALVVAAPAAALAGSVQQSELVEDASAARLGPSRAPSHEAVPSGLALARIFRPPGPSFD